MGEDADLEQYIGQITRAVQSSKEKVKTKVQHAVEGARGEITDMLKKKRREIATSAQKDIADAKKWVDLEEQRLQELHESCVGLMKQAQAELKKAEDEKESLQEQWEESTRKYKSKGNLQHLLGMLQRELGEES